MIMFPEMIKTFSVSLKKQNRQQVIQFFMADLL